MLKILVITIVLSAMVLKAEALSSTELIYEWCNVPKNGAALVRVRHSTANDIWLEGVNAAGTDAEKVIWKKPFLLTSPVSPYSGVDNPICNGYNIEFNNKSGGFQTHQTFRWNGKELKLICVNTEDYSGDKLSKLLTALDTGNPKELAKYKEDPGFDHPQNYINSKVLEMALERGHRAAIRSYHAGHIAQAAARLALTFETCTCMAYELEGEPDIPLNGINKWIASLNGEMIDGTTGEMTKVSPDKFIPLLNDYSHFLQLRGKHQQAIEVRRAIANIHSTPLTACAPKKESHLADAEKELRSSLSRTPDNQENILNLAFVLRNEGKLDEALHWAKQLVALNKTSDTLHLLAIIYGDIGDLQHSFDTYKQAETSLPANSGEKEQLTKMITVLSEVVCNDTPRKKESADFTNYLVRATPCGLVRWPNNKPIIVCIKPQPYIIGWTPRLTRIVKEAFTDWAAASGGRLSFSFTEKPLGANITMLWGGPENLFGPYRDPLDQGDTQLFIDHGGYYNAIINLYDAGAYSDNLTKRIYLHEIGHALGLLGHSNNSSDIMYCFLKESDARPTLSLRDKATILQLYRKARSPAEEKLYRSNAFNFLKAMEYDQEGIDLENSENYPAALISFQKSLKLVPGFSQAKMHADLAQHHLQLNK